MSVSFSLRQGSITSQEIMRIGTLTWSYMIRGATFYEECIQWNGTRWYETVWNNTLQYCIVSEVSPIWDAFLTYCNHSTLCAVSLICLNNCDWILYCHSTHFVCSASSARISLDPTISTCCFHLVNLGPELKGARPGSVQCSWCLRRSRPHWPHCTHLYTSVHCHRCHRMLPALDTSTQGLSVMDVERHAATHKIFCCEISRCGSTSDIEAVSNRSIALQPVGWSSAGIPGSNFTQAVTAAFSHCMWNFKVEEGQKIEPYWLKPRWVWSYWQLGII